MPFSLTAKPSKPKAKKTNDDTTMRSYGRGGAGNMRKRQGTLPPDNTDTVSINSTTLVVNTPSSPFPGTDETGSRTSHDASQHSGTSGFHSSIHDLIEEIDQVDGSEVNELSPERTIHAVHNGVRNERPIDGAPCQAAFYQDNIRANPERPGGSSGFTGRGGAGNRNRQGSGASASPTVARRSGESSSSDSPSSTSSHSRNIPRLRSHDFGRPLSPSMMNNIVITEAGDEDEPPLGHHPTISSRLTDDTDSELYPRRPIIPRLVIATDRDTFIEYSNLGSVISLSSLDSELRAGPSSSAFDPVSADVAEIRQTLNASLQSSALDGSSSSVHTTSTRSRASSISARVTHAVLVPVTPVSGNIAGPTDTSTTPPLELPITLPNTTPAHSPMPEEPEPIDPLNPSPQALPNAQQSEVKTPNHIYGALTLWAGMSVILAASLIQTV